MPLPSGIGVMAHYVILRHSRHGTVGNLDSSPAVIARRGSIEGDRYHGARASEACSADSDLTDHGARCLVVGLFRSAGHSFGKYRREQ